MYEQGLFTASSGEDSLRLGLTGRDVKIATIFTGVEIITLSAWFAVINNPVLAVVTLGIGLEVEHLISRLK